MSTLYNNIISLCNEHGISGGKLCVELGISKSTLTSLKQGRTKSLSSENSRKIADYFNVTVDALYGVEETKKEPGLSTELSDDIIDVVDKIHSLPDEKQKLFLQLANPLLDSLMSDEK